MFVKELLVLEVPRVRPDAAGKKARRVARAARERPDLADLEVARDHKESAAQPVAPESRAKQARAAPRAVLECRDLRGRRVSKGIRVKAALAALRDLRAVLGIREREEKRVSKGIRDLRARKESAVTKANKA